MAAPARDPVAAPAMPERREAAQIRQMKVLNKANEGFSLFPGKCVDDPNSDDEVDEDAYALNALETELAAVLQQFKKKGTRGKAQGKAKPQGKKNKREFFWEKVSKTKKRKAPAPLDPPLAKVVPPAAKVVPPSTEVAPPSAEVDQAVVVPTPAEVVPPPTVIDPAEVVPLPAENDPAEVVPPPPQRSIRPLQRAMQCTRRAAGHMCTIPHTATLSSRTATAMRIAIVRSILP